jgi:hypothetical protein
MPLSRSTFLHSLCNESTTVTHPKMFGLLAVILSLAMVMSKLVRREGIYKSDLILSRIVIFVIGTAVVTALGQYDMEASPDTFRYGTDKLT